MINKVFFLSITSLILLIIGYQLLKKDLIDHEIINDHISNNISIKYNDYSIPKIDLKTHKDLYFSNGFLQANFRLFQLEYLRAYSQGRIADNIDTALVDIDFITRRIINVASSKAEFDTLENKSSYKGFCNGINTKLDLLKTLPLEFGIFNIKKKKWEEWEVYHLDKFLRLFSNSNFITKLENEFIQRSELNDIVKENNGIRDSSLRSLNINYLNQLYNWFYEFKIEDILIGDNINDRFSIISISDDFELQSYYFPVFFCVNDNSNYLNISQVGLVEPLISINKDSSYLHINPSNVNAFTYSESNNVFLDRSNNQINMEIDIDTLLKDNTRLKYLYKDLSRHSYLLNFDELDTVLLSLKPELIDVYKTKVDSTIFLSKNIYKKQRLNNLLTSIIKFNNLELQLILNDDVDEQLLLIRDKISSVLDSNKSKLSQDQINNLHELKNWEGTCNYLDPYSLYSLDVIYKIVDKTVNFFIKNENILFRNSFKIDLFTKIMNEYDLNELIIKLFKNQELSINDFSIENYKNKFIDLDLIKEKFDPNGSPNSIKHFDYNSSFATGNVLTIIYDKERDLLDLQMIGGMSGELQNQNFKDQFSLWKTSGFLKVDLNNFNASDSIKFIAN